MYGAIIGDIADGVEYTKAWVLNWKKVADAAWFEIPKIMPVKPIFDLRAILLNILLPKEKAEVKAEAEAKTEG